MLENNNTLPPSPCPSSSSTTTPVSSPSPPIFIQEQKEKQEDTDSGKSRIELESSVSRLVFPKVDLSINAQQSLRNQPPLSFIQYISHHHLHHLHHLHPHHPPVCCPSFPPLQNEPLPLHPTFCQLYIVIFTQKSSWFLPSYFTTYELYSCSPKIIISFTIAIIHHD